MRKFAFGFLLLIFANLVFAGIADSLVQVATDTHSVMSISSVFLILLAAFSYFFLKKRETVIAILVLSMIFLILSSSSCGFVRSFANFSCGSQCLQSDCTQICKDMAASKNADALIWFERLSLVLVTAGTVVFAYSKSKNLGDALNTVLYYFLTIVFLVILLMGLVGFLSPFLKSLGYFWWIIPAFIVLVFIARFAFNEETKPIGGNPIFAFLLILSGLLLLIFVLYRMNTSDVLLCGDLLHVCEWSCCPCA